MHATRGFEDTFPFVVVGNICDHFHRGFETALEMLSRHLWCFYMCIYLLNRVTQAKRQARIHTSHSHTITVAS